ncbi:hypothetical protein SAMN04515671_2920 [Nakamurella panacisegetis]|uniref:Head-to-tail stopper n=1 Tax=Nakamurella panacisegetis TaxID=1090615 RepID=A0A1H0PWX2_9ACTN|nr:hypothetical protein SAMN04515671_2920 [Nakamurella panacisegetis]
MPPPLAHGVDVRVFARLAPGETDSHGNAVKRYAPAVLVAGCAVAPGAQGEIADPTREGVPVALTVYAPWSAAVGPLDQCEVDGWPGRFEVDGEPARWRSPYTGRTPGQVIELRKVDG